MLVHDYPGVLGVLSLWHEHDTILVLPTLEYGLEWWPIYLTAADEHHDSAHLVKTKTGLLCRISNRTLRLWVPYEREATMPMDWPVYRKSFDLVSPWFTKYELRRWLV